MLTHCITSCATFSFRLPHQHSATLKYSSFGFVIEQFGEAVFQPVDIYVEFDLIQWLIRTLMSLGGLAEKK
jgi:hypothetical protein